MQLLLIRNVNPTRDGGVRDVTLTGQRSIFYLQMTSLGCPLTNYGLPEHEGNAMRDSLS